MAGLIPAEAYQTGKTRLPSNSQLASFSEQGVKMADQSHLEKLQNLRSAMVEKRRETVDSIIEQGGLNKTFLQDASLFRKIIAVQDIVEGLDRVIRDERNLPGSPEIPNIAEDLQGSGSRLNN